MKRTTKITARVTQEEYDLIYEKAKRHGLKKYITTVLDIVILQMKLLIYPLVQKKRFFKRH